jgi:hypothetical protein
VRVSVEELINQADAICARYGELETPLRAALPKDDSPEAYQRVAELLPQLGMLLRQQVAELAELEPRRTWRTSGRTTWTA